MTSHSYWGERTAATEVAEAFSERINGKVVLITGVSPTSLGESLAHAFSLHSPSLLILASRTPSKIEAVASKLPSSCPIKPIELDLSSESSIRAAVDSIKHLTDHIDILINNAGVVHLDPSWTSAGIETGFYTNHIGPFLFTNLLLPLFLESTVRNKHDGSTRVVNVTSQGHRISPIRFSDPNFHVLPDQLPAEERPASYAVEVFKPKPNHGGYAWGYSYGQSKTANILFAHALNYRFADPNDFKGIVSAAVHPGSIWTDLSRHLDKEAVGLIEKTSGYWKTLDQGSATTTVAALDPAIGRKEIGSKEVSGAEHVVKDGAGMHEGEHANGSRNEKEKEDGKGHRKAFMSDCQFIEEAPHARGREMSERLWKLSEEILGEKFEW